MKHFCFFFTIILQKKKSFLGGSNRELTCESLPKTKKKYPLKRGSNFLFLSHG